MHSPLTHIVSKLESLTQKDVPISKGLDMLEAKAKSRKDLIMINVMRDSMNEMMYEERRCQAV